MDAPSRRTAAAASEPADSHGGLLPSRAACRDAIRVRSGAVRRGRHLECGSEPNATAGVPFFLDKGSSALPRTERVALSRIVEQRESRGALLLDVVVSSAAALESRKERACFHDAI